jgi:hypothetical protein
MSTPGATPAWAAAGSTFSATATGTLAVNVPAHAAGDLRLLVAHARASSSNGAISVGAPWAQVGGAGSVYGGNQLSRIALAWKLGDGAETSVAVTFGGTGTVRFQARVHRFTAADGFPRSGSPLGTVAVATGTGASIGLPTVIPAAANRRAVAVLAASASTAMADATGEAGGDWTLPTPPHLSTNGTLALQISDQSGGGAISGGGVAITPANWVALGFAVLPVSLDLLDGDDLDLAAPFLATPTIDAEQIVDLAMITVLFEDRDVVAVSLEDV